MAARKSLEADKFQELDLDGEGAGEEAVTAGDNVAAGEEAVATGGLVTVGDEGVTVGNEGVVAGDFLDDGEVEGGAAAGETCGVGAAELATSAKII